MRVKKPVKDAVAKMTKRAGCIITRDEAIEFLARLKFLSLRDKLNLMYAYTRAQTLYHDNPTEFRLMFYKLLKETGNDDLEDDE